MERTLSNPSQGRVTKRDRRVWTVDEENTLLDGLEEIIAHGMKSDNSFKVGYMNLLEKWFEDKLPYSKIKGNPHIESKMKNLKKLYNQLYDLKCQSGLGWDNERHCIVIYSEDSWQAYCKVYPRAASLRGKSFPHFDRLSNIFGKDQARGSQSEDPSEAHIATGLEQLEDVEVNFQPQISLQSQSSGEHSRRKRPRASEKWVSSLSGITNSFISYLEKANEVMELIANRIGHAKDLDNDKRRVNVELQCMSLNIMDKMKVCKKIVTNPDYIHLFYGYQGEERKIFVDMLLQEIRDAKE